MTTNFFSPLSFVVVFGSGIQDPGSGMGKNQDPGSGINIPDPQHCFWVPEKCGLGVKPDLGLYWQKQNATGTFLIEIGDNGVTFANF